MNGKFFENIWGVSKASFKKSRCRSTKSIKNLAGVLKSGKYTLMHRNLRINIFSPIELMKISTEKSSHAPGQSLWIFLSQWALDKNMTHSASDDLLRRYHQELSKTARTLLATPKTAEQIEMGVEINLIAFCSTLMKNKISLPENIIFDFNMDGVNYNESAQASLWLIQMDFRNFEFDPFLVGTYKGINKPGCNEFLKPLVG